jgi:ubiquinone/menaquinone biosynthesis C-methylase UbiE
MRPVPDCALKERTVAGLHESLVRRLPASLPRDAMVLDIGCGTGASISRLRAHGFTQLHGIDRDVSRLAIGDVTVFQSIWTKKSGAWRERRSD